MSNGASGPASFRTGDAGFGFEHAMNARRKIAPAISLRTIDLCLEQIRGDHQMHAATDRFFVDHRLEVAREHAEDGEHRRPNDGFDLLVELRTGEALNFFRR